MNWFTNEQRCKLVVPCRLISMGGLVWWLWYLIQGEYSSSQPDIEHLTDHVMSAKEGLVRHHMISCLIIVCDVAILPSLPSNDTVFLPVPHILLSRWWILAHLSPLALGVSEGVQVEIQACKNRFYCPRREIIQKLHFADYEGFGNGATRDVLGGATNNSEQNI